MAQDGERRATRGLTVEEIELGMQARVENTVMDEDIRSFATVSGDYNPVHLDAEFAKGTPFGNRISHGMLTASYISAVFGMHLPGPGAIYVTQTLNFKRPVWIGDVIRTTVTVDPHEEGSGVPRRTLVVCMVCRKSAQSLASPSGR